MNNRQGGIVVVAVVVVMVGVELRLEWLVLRCSMAKQNHENCMDRLGMTCPLLKIRADLQYYSSCYQHP